jgi:hypothetical protein
LNIKRTELKNIVVIFTPTVNIYHAINTGKLSYSGYRNNLYKILNILDSIIWHNVVKPKNKSKIANKNQKF